MTSAFYCKKKTLCDTGWNTFHKILAKEADLDLPDSLSRKPPFIRRRLTCHPSLMGPWNARGNLSQGGGEHCYAALPWAARSTLTCLLCFFLASWVVSVEVFTRHARAHSRFRAWALTRVFNPVCTFPDFPVVSQVGAARGARVITLSAAGVGDGFWGF